jgi:hypothetical protein
VLQAPHCAPRSDLFFGRANRKTLGFVAEKRNSLFVRDQSLANTF